MKYKKSCYIAVLILFASMCFADTMEYENTLVISNYSITNEGKFDIIKVDNWDYVSLDNYFYLPIFEEKLTYSLDTLVLEPKIISFSDGIDIEVNTPCMMGEQFFDKSVCTGKNSKPYIEEYTFILDRNQKVKLLINPFEVIDENTVRLYRNISYSLSLRSESTLMAIGLGKSYDGYIGQTKSIGFTIKNIGDKKDNVIFKTVDSKNRVLEEKTITLNSGDNPVETNFIIPNKTGENQLYFIIQEDEEELLNEELRVYAKKAEVDIGFDTEFALDEPIEYLLNFSNVYSDLKDVKVYFTLSKSWVEEFIKTESSLDSTGRKEYKFIQQTTGIPEGTYYLDINVIAPDKTMIGSKSRQITIAGVKETQKLIPEENPENTSTTDPTTTQTKGNTIILVSLAVLLTGLVLYFGIKYMKN